MMIVLFVALACRRDDADGTEVRRGLAARL